MPPRPCRTPHCSEYSTSHGYCDTHQQEAKAHGWDHKGKSRHERGYGSAWDKLRALIMKRDNFLCQVCLVNGRYSQAHSVDHITSKAMGGADSHANLQAICNPCHDAKTLRERTGR